MSAAELYKAKLDLIAWINQLSDVNMIEFLESLRTTGNTSDSWDDLPESHKAEIEKGLKAIENGDVLSSVEFWKKLKNTE